MKNTNFKTKLIARIMLLVLLLASALNFAGCSERHEHEFYANYNCGTQIIAHAFSDTDVFNIENVSISLSYAVHKLNILGQVDSNPKLQLSGIFHNDKLTFEVCVCSEIHSCSYKGSNCCMVLKTISEKDIFAKEYGYIDTPFFISNGVVFMHTEKINIPSSLFTDDHGYIKIKLMLFIGEENINGHIYQEQEIYLPESETIINIEYKKIGDDQIELVDNWK